MIEKLKTINPYDETEIDMDIGSVGNLVYENTPLIQKINEVIDVVNNIVSVQEKLVDCFVVKTKQEAPVDKYAEQCKWIGCLCRFWNFKDGAVDIGILKAIDNLKPKIPYINDIDCSYAFCEPVKPTDSIIYKGGDK